MTMTENKLLVFTTAWCDACHSEMPRIKQAANKLGLTVQEVNVDRCSVAYKDLCAQIEWVPTLMFNGKEVSIEQLQNMANKR